jgi:Peptidase_C39 like family
LGRTLGRSPGRVWSGLLFVLALTGSRTLAQTSTETSPQTSAPTLRVPAVPYLAQTEALCGGAALAMVLRYWGVTGVGPEDFAAALTSQGTGIPTEAMAHLAEAKGFQAFPFQGSPQDVVEHLEKGRPVIALLAAAPGRYHYVVVLAWANRRVLVHDPAVGPYRIIPEGEWQKRWEASGRWALLVLPPDGLRGGAPTIAATPPKEDPCTALVQPGVELALAGTADEARELLATMTAWCPGSSTPAREMASAEFRRERWSAAADFAAEAVRRDPMDRFAWKLLATSRFLAGRRLSALSAWNRIDEPRLDLVQINGLQQTPTPVATAYLGEDPGALLTPARFRRVERRIEALPAVKLARVSYRPLSGGKVQLEVNVVERAAFSSPLSIALQSAMRAVSEHAIGAEAFALAASGDSLKISGRWRSERSFALLSASAPHFFGLPGIVTAEAIWDEQSYRVSPGGAENALARERRQRASLSLAHWWAADTRVVLTVAGDAWRDRGRYLSLSSAIEQRLIGDRLAVEGTAAGWWSGVSAPFYVASARLAARSCATAVRPRVSVEASYELASGRAPLALWPGAGAGTGRVSLLRAHPLVHDGVVDGVAFGRQLLSGTVQGETPIGSVGPARLRAAAFIDVAKVVTPRREGTVVDVGAGLRVQPPGWRSSLRVDLATPWGSLHPQLSVGWQGEWR